MSGMSERDSDRRPTLCLLYFASCWRGGLVFSQNKNAADHLRFAAALRHPSGAKNWGDVELDILHRTFSIHPLESEPRLLFKGEAASEVSPDTNPQAVWCAATKQIDKGEAEHALSQLQQEHPKYHQTPTLKRFGAQRQKND